MYFTGKGCDIAPYTDAYEKMKSVPVVQEATSYYNPNTGETMILILNKDIWTSATMDNTLVNPNQFHAYGMTFQCMKLVGVHQGVIHGWTCPDIFFED